jgi:hypothetical protein
MYKVKKEDLIGKTEGFEIEIVQKMVEHQFAQTGKYDITVFQKLKSASKGLEGFNWILSPEGEDFWGQVILSKNFDLFFSKYPKNPLELKDLVSEWTEEKEKYSELSQALKFTFNELDKKIKDYCGQKFNLPDFYFVGDWGWCQVGFMVKSRNTSKGEGFQCSFRGVIPKVVKREDHWPISLKELKALNEGLSNILLADIFDEIVKLNS